MIANWYFCWIFLDSKFTTTKKLNSSIDIGGDEIHHWCVPTVNCLVENFKNLKILLNNSDNKFSNHFTELATISNGSLRSMQFLFRLQFKKCSISNFDFFRTFNSVRTFDFLIISSCLALKKFD